VSDTLSIGQEFFRWEFATAVAGAVMGINPFDQPDVEAAKIATRKLTEEFERSGHLPAESPILSSDGISIFSGENSSHATSLEASLLEHVDRVDRNDYFAILAYLEMSPENQILLQKMRQSVLRRTGAATTVGFGPRFLHSTGQAHKGGANNGVFLMLTADDAEDIAVPGRRYSFAIVKDAQARGDFEVLTKRGRRVMRLHLSGDLTKQLERVTDILKK
jgi:transaldolase/glucose-6-phosphate isomerase